MRRPRPIPLLVLAVAVMAAGFGLWSIASAQEDEAEQRSRFIRFVERTISTPDRQIRLGRIEGALSSDVRIASITIADREGVWLTITGARMVWSIQSLVFGKLDISELEAEEIAIERRPLPPEEAPPPEAELTIPELPVSVEIGQLDVPRIQIGEPVFGRAATLDVAGGLLLEGGDLDTDLEVERLDGPGGRLALEARFSNATQELDLDLRLDEPADGVVANMLNLPDRPALSFAIVGSGPLDDFAADISLEADGAELLSGSAEIARVADGYRFVADVGGRLDALVPPEYGHFVTDGSTLRIDATRADDGAVSIHQVDVSSGVMMLSADAELAPDLFPLSFALDARLGDDSDDPVTLPVAGEPTVGGARITAEVGPGEDWSARFTLDDLDATSLTMERAVVTAGGIARDRDDPESREVTFELMGAATGVDSPDAAVAAALGTRLDLSAVGDWAAGQPVTVESARVALPHAEATFAGRIVAGVAEGDFRLAGADLAPFSGLAGTELAGTADVEAEGSVGAERFALTVDGAADDLRLGVPALDGLFTGRTALSGDIARDADTPLRVDELVLDGSGLTARLDGAYGREEADLALDARLADLSLVTDRAAGAADLAATVTGSPERPRIEARITGDDLALLDHAFSDAEANFDGMLDGGDAAGTLSLTGILDGVAIDLGARLSSREGNHALQELSLRAGETVAAGDLTLRADGLATGDLRLDSPDISVIGPLLLADMAGGVSADISLREIDGGQAAEVTAALREFRYDGVSIGRAELEAAGQDLRRAPILSGSLDAAEVTVGAVEIDTLEATAERTGARTEFAATAGLVQGTLSAEGALDPHPDGFDLALETLTLDGAAIDAALAEPVVLAVRGGAVSIPRSRLTVGAGSVTVGGEAGETLDLAADIEALDLAFVNVLAPGVGLAGTVAGNVTVTGPAADPRGEFAVSAEGVSAQALQNLGVGPMSVTADGGLADGTISLDAEIAGGGIDLTASGDVPLEGAGLSLSLAGSLPLSLADAVLAEQGARLTGTLTVDMTVGGSLAEPRFNGSLSTDGAGFVHRETGIQLRELTLRATLAEDRLVIETLRAAAVPDGTLDVTGSVGLAPDAGFPVDLAATLRDIRYADGRLVTARFDADLTLTGPVLREARLAGTVAIDRAEITVPESLPRGAAMLDVDHRAAPIQVLETLERARVDERAERAGPAALRLDLSVEAPARVFVRGRGLDAEFGGRVTLTGPASDIRPIGDFDMRRGHINVIGQRITFDRGTVTLFGDLDPILDFVATTRVRTITVTAAVGGRASDPEITLSSVPELPQDEVLAQFLFGRSLNDLSPLQIAQLATAASGLVGGTDAGGLLGSLRAATGLDELDVVTGEEGGVAVQAGRYVTENVYLGVRAGAEGDSGVTVNLDITEELTTRGEVGADGRSKLGIFFEREY